MPAPAIYTALLLVITDKVTDAVGYLLEVIALIATGFSQIGSLEIVECGRAEIAGVENKRLGNGVKSYHTIVVGDKQAVGQRSESGP